MRSLTPHRDLGSQNTEDPITQAPPTIKSTGNLTPQDGRITRDAVSRAVQGGPATRGMASQAPQEGSVAVGVRAPTIVNPDKATILSPWIFNTFINDLLVGLNMSEHKVCIGTNYVNSFAYADDVNLMCTTVYGLQCLTDKCAMNARGWRFKFGLKNKMYGYLGTFPV